MNNFIKILSPDWRHLNVSPWLCSILTPFANGNYAAREKYSKILW